MLRRSREEVGQVIRSRGGEGLLDFFGAGEVGEDAGAFDRGAAFQVVSCGPGGGRVVFRWSVKGAEVDGRCFI